MHIYIFLFFLHSLAYSIIFVAHHDFSAMAFLALCFFSLSCSHFRSRCMQYFSVHAILISECMNTFRFELVEFGYSRSAFGFCCHRCRRRSILGFFYFFFIHLMYLITWIKYIESKSKVDFGVKLQTARIFDIIIFGILGSCMAVWKLQLPYTIPQLIHVILICYRFKWILIKTIQCRVGTKKKESIYTHTNAHMRFKMFSSKFKNRYIIKQKIRILKCVIMRWKM